MHLYTYFSDPFWRPIEHLPKCTGLWTVGRSMPDEKGYQLAIAFYDSQTGIWWMNPNTGQLLSWEPTYFATAPTQPPWSDPKGA